MRAPSINLDECENWKFEEMDASNRSFRESRRKPRNRAVVDVEAARSIADRLAARPDLISLDRCFQLMECDDYFSNGSHSGVI